jgi:hypothetical protein
LTECSVVRKKFFPEDRFEAKEETLNSTCEIFFTDKELKDELSDEVGCEDYCANFYAEPEEEEEYETCMSDCEENVDLAVRGNIHFNKETLEVESATIPIEPVRLMQENKWGELEFSEEKVEELRRKLHKIGCEPEELSWVHPHELRPGAGEWEEEPGIYYIHVSKSEAGKCRLSDLLEVL